MKLTEFYQTVGGDYADAMSRLQNDAFIVRFLRMLPRDGSMALLTEAVAAAVDGDTITLLVSGNGNGIQFPSGKFNDKGLTIDFNEQEYMVGGVLVGSAETGTNAFQLLKDNKITFRNGSIIGVTENTKPAEDTPNWHGAPAIMIQNYSDLTLDNMVVSGGDETCYTVSNNNGNVTIKDTTVNPGQAKGSAYLPTAFDVCRFSSYPSVSVTVEGNSVINGDVEVSGAIGEGQSRQLTITGGVFTGAFRVVDQPANITITGGTFAVNPSAYVAEGYGADKNANGTWTVVKADGSEEQPYLISTGEQAYNMRNQKGYFKLVDDVVVTNEIYLSSKTVVIDLNGHSVRLEYADGVKPNNGGVFNISGKKSSLTINDSSNGEGKVIGSDKTYTNKVTSAVRVGNYGKLTINGGHFYGMNEGTSCIFTMTSMASGSKGTVVINGGTFETASPSNGIYYVLNHQDSATGGCTMTVNGGTFKEYNPGVTHVDPVNAKTGKIVLGTGCTTTSEVINGATWYTVSK